MAAESPKRVGSCLAGLAAYSPTPAVQAGDAATKKM